MASDAPKIIRLPLDLLRGTLEPAEAAAPCVLLISDDYEHLAAQPELLSEVFGIQRLLTMARAGAVVAVEWSAGIAARLEVSASLFPLLAVVLSLTGVRHQVQDQSQHQSESFLLAARRAVGRYRLTADLFSTSQIALCADNLGLGRPRDLYEQGSGMVARRENFETLMLDVISRLVGSSVERSVAFKNARALGVIVAELFENTHLHGRLDLSGKPLGPNAMRGLILKRVELASQVAGTSEPRIRDCLEILVFDTGIGYYPSYMKQALSGDTSLSDEWKVLHNCLERHYFPELEDRRSSHRAMGLAEVLKLIQALKGRIEIRTGRLFAYRTFLEGELQTQMEERSSRFAHLSWPRPKMLDVEKRYVAIPTEHPPIVGSAVRVLVPLS